MSEVISNDKVKAHHFHATKRFIDEFGTSNDGGVLNDVYKDIYPPKLQLKVERSGTHAFLLNLDIRVKDGVSVYKFFDKRDAFPFLSFAYLTLIVTFPCNIYIYIYYYYYYYYNYYHYHYYKISYLTHGILSAAFPFFDACHSASCFLFL